ncbi:phosphoribosyltransferase family protein [Mucilaginibacter myungsuensis]|uniref:Phosphoribosyltransferase n=1 Tax=Mucilaginibacter myungsuensis TaxID=649104 RepID=A0A929KZS3_9SPHI|nr:phosphoribosyltransferase family protein [Mucilaginibacter myungsuensis]MBE9661545.1 phosphoribosyltransferase [Mucilaginibacter myungsuensis]MDN3597688.1 phosphoribosyltransferase family protein [Mucilaginibacter myungsuensis]
MPDTKRIPILSAQQIQQKLDRIAYQILEDNFEETELIIAGIQPRGNFIASRLKAILESISHLQITQINIELQKESTHLEAKTDTPLQICANKVVILVDDVLNSGKTLAYGFGVFLDLPLKKLRTVVLVDRNHKSFPITTDYAGVALSTVLKEHIEVVLTEYGDADEVYMR